MMSNVPQELAIPKSVLEAKGAMELVRIWVADGSQISAISPNLWKDPGSWGLMLVDLANHVASAYEAQGWNRAEVLSRIKKAYDVEWAHPTDTAL